MEHFWISEVIAVIISDCRFESEIRFAPMDGIGRGSAHDNLPALVPIRLIPIAGIEEVISAILCAIDDGSGTDGSVLIVGSSGGQYFSERGIVHEVAGLGGIDRMVGNFGIRPELLEIINTEHTRLRIIEGHGVTAEAVRGLEILDIGADVEASH